MDDNLSAFIANGIEFIVGGSVFLAASLFLLFALGWEPVRMLSPDLVSMPISSAGLVFVLLVAGYATGVVVESACRAGLEWDLNRVTVRHPDFVAPAPGRQPGSGARKPKTQNWRFWYLGRPGSDDRPAAVGDRYSEQDLMSAVDAREHQRARVMTMHAGFTADVQSQLKRLRLERVVLMSSLMVTLGFVALQQWWPTLVALLVTIVMGRLVHSRFGRYCGAIARGFKLVSQGEALVPAGTLATEAPT